jgi:hypothetical protein
MSAKAEKKTEIATQINGVVAERPEWLKEGHAGSEDVTANEMILPRIDVIQALSPQIKKNDPAFIPGAEQGVIFNTVTGELYGPEITFVPVLFRKEFTVWKLRKAGGGFCGAYKHEADAEFAVSQMENPSDYEVVESHQHFCIALTEHGPQEAVFSMTKSKLKVSRALNTLVQIAGVDRFAKAYKLCAVEDSGAKGDYWTFKAHPVGFVSEDLYKKGRQLYEMIKAGAADVDRSSEGDAGSGSTSTSGSAEL